MNPERFDAPHHTHEDALHDPLRAALWALPQETAPAHMWAQLAARLGPRASTHGPSRRSVRERLQGGLRWLLPLAACACAVLWWPWSTLPPQTHTDPLAALMTQSQKLESRLADLRSTPTRYSARAARLEQSLADGLALTDLQLSVATDPDQTTQLWQRRVALLSTWLDLNAIGPELGAAAPAGAGSETTATQEEPWL